MRIYIEGARVSNNEETVPYARLPDVLSVIYVS